MGHRAAIAENGPAVDADSGCDAVSGKSRVSVTQAAFRVGGVAPEEVVGGFIGRGAVVPAHSQIEGQFLGYLPVILSIGGKIAEDMVLRIAGLVRRAQRSGHISDRRAVVSEQEISHGIASAA